MANITQFFRVALLLSNGEGQSEDRFFENFENATMYRHADRKFIYKYDELEWEYCTQGCHLICLAEFSTLEEAEAAEQSAFEILSDFEYFDSEED